MKKILLFLFLAINSIAYSQSYSNTGTYNLPDGVTYHDTITISGFNAGAQVSATTILDSLKVTLEHSYLGDLEMLLICPNGDSVTIFNSSTGSFAELIPGGFGGSNRFLGQPNDSSDLFGIFTPGIGEEYIWSSTYSSFGDFPTEFAANNFITLTNPPSPSPGNSMNWNGIYAPEEPFINLIGCPLNGDWVITIRDNILQDDGYVFGWGLSFDTLYTPPPVPPLAISLDSLDASCSLCNGTATVNVVNGYPPYAYSWNTVPAQLTPAITGLCPGTYAVTVTDSLGTVLVDSILITGTSAPIIDSIITTVDDGNCSGSATAYVTSSIPYTLSWNPTLQTTNPAINLCDGQYCIAITDTNGCSDYSCDTVNLETVIGLSELKLPVVTIYPNPIQNQFSISLEHPTSGSIKIKNAMGQLVFSNSFNNSNKIDIDLDVAKGTYFLQLEIDNQLIIKKIIKK